MTGARAVEVIILLCLSAVQSRYGSGATDLLEGYRANQQRIGSWAIKCQVLSEFSDGQNTARPTESGRACDLRWDGSRVSVRCSKWRDGGRGQRLGGGRIYLSMTWDGKKYLVYRQPDPNKPGRVYIDDMSRLASEQRDWEIRSLQYAHDVAMLMGFYPGNFERLDTVLDHAETLSVRGSTELINGSPCHVVDARTSGGNYAIWVDAQHGFNIAKVHIVRRREEGHRYYDKLVRETLSVFTLDNVRFKEVQGTWVAVEADYSTRTVGDGPKAMASLVKAHIKIDEITLNPDHDALRSFTGGDVPSGTEVFVQPVTHIRYLWTDGELVTKVDEKAVEKIDRVVASLSSPTKIVGASEGQDANGLLADAGAISPADSTDGESSEPNVQAQAGHGEKKEEKPRGIILPRPYCGLYCVYATLKRMDRDVNFRDLVKLEYVGSGDGSTMAELGKAARDNGLFAGVAARLSTKGLSQFPYPAILHVKPDWSHRPYDHYELYLGTEDGQAKLFDPPDKLRLVPFRELAGRWDGYALAISDKRFDIAAIFGPDRQKLMLRVALGVLVLLGVHLLVSRTSILHWAATWKRRVGLSLGQAGGLTLAALVCALVCHVANPEGLLANTSTTTSFREAYLGTFVPKIGFRQTRRLLKADTVVVDARYKEDYHGGHLTGAISLPIDANEAVWRMTTEAIPKNARILVYCQSAGCKFAERVGSQLLKDGFSNVSVFRGGWQEWTARNGGPAKNRSQKEDGADPNGRTGESIAAGAGN